MCDVYTCTWFIALSSRRERDVERMNEKSIHSQSWINTVIAVIVSKVELTVRLLQ